MSIDQVFYRIQVLPFGWQLITGKPGNDEGHTLYMQIDDYVKAKQ